MEKEKMENKIVNFDIDALTDEELERYQNSIRQEQIARRKAALTVRSCSPFSGAGRQ